MQTKIQMFGTEHGTVWSHIVMYEMGVGRYNGSTCSGTLNCKVAGGSDIRESSIYQVQNQAEGSDVTSY